MVVHDPPKQGPKTKKPKMPPFPSRALKKQKAYTGAKGEANYMPFDLQKIDGDIERLNQIRRFMADPRSVELLDQFYVQATNSMASKENRDAAQTAPYANGSPQGEYGSQTKLVCDVLARLRGTFTAGTVGNQLRASGVKISNMQVSKVFARLQKHTEIQMVEQGAGRIPSTYQKTKNFVQAE